MSREERRAYRRMMKNADPYAPPVPRGAAGRQGDRLARRRAGRSARGPADSRFLTPRFVGLTLVTAAAVAILAFSLWWPNGMPDALIVGIAAGVVWIALAIGLRMMLRRAPPPART